MIEIHETYDPHSGLTPLGEISDDYAEGWVMAQIDELRHGRETELCTSTRYVYCLKRLQRRAREKLLEDGSLCLNQDLLRLGIAVYADILKEARARCRGWNGMNAAQSLTVLQHETKKRLIRAFRDRHRNPGDYTRTGRLKR